MTADWALLWHLNLRNTAAILAAYVNSATECDQRHALSAKPATLLPDICESPPVSCASQGYEIASNFHSKMYNTVTSLLNAMSHNAAVFAP